MKIGSLYLFKPFQLEYNPEHHRPPIVGIYLGKMIVNNLIPRYIVLGPNGIEHLWNNRWAVEEEL